MSRSSTLTKRKPLHKKWQKEHPSPRTFFFRFTPCQTSTRQASSSSPTIRSLFSTSSFIDSGAAAVAWTVTVKQEFGTHPPRVCSKFQEAAKIKQKTDDFSLRFELRERRWEDTVLFPLSLCSFGGCRFRRIYLSLLSLCLAGKKVFFVCFEFDGKCDLEVEKHGW